MILCFQAMNIVHGASYTITQGRNKGSTVTTNWDRGWGLDIPSYSGTLSNIPVDIVCPSPSQSSNCHNCGGTFQSEKGTCGVFISQNPGPVNLFLGKA
ncbi:MAG TPA: hypothetical protein VHA52_02100 [Candidatus Babeliaceae bacterium]|nr:hypothetical protein [Candidatus Babeliaceae bacterium]